MDMEKHGNFQHIMFHGLGYQKWKVWDKNIVSAATISSHHEGSRLSVSYQFSSPHTRFLWIDVALPHQEHIAVWD